MKIPKVFPKIPGSKILENPVPKNPGIEILDPARAWSWSGKPVDPIGYMSTCLDPEGYMSGS